MKQLFFVALVGALTFTSCKKEDITSENTTTPTTPTNTKTLIATDTTSANEIVELYADASSIKTGYTPLYIKVKDLSGNVSNSANVMFMPMMDMGTMQHSSPYEQPVYNSTTGLYEGIVIFTMSSTSGVWTLTVTINGNPVDFIINVQDSTTKIVGSYTGEDSEVYIVSLVQPVKWHVGMNDLQIMIHRKESMMSFVPVSDMVIEMTPEMVSMGHGSPNNISPVAIGNGYYDGEVNFTMTGDWRLHFHLEQNGVHIHEDAYLDILF